MIAANGVNVLVDGLTFPECPRWHDGSFWFSDFYSHRVLSVRPGEVPVVQAEIDGQPAGLGWDAEGLPVVVSMRDRSLLRRGRTGFEPMVDLSRMVTGPLNDLVVDVGGRVYVGSFGYDLFGGEAPRPGNIVRVEPDGLAQQGAGDLDFPNGMAFTSDNRTLIVAETFGHRLTAFDVAADGSLGDRRIWAAFDEAITPDGIALDREGAVWVADASGRCVLRVIDGGDVLEKISTGPELVFACCLGGDDGRTLALCVAPTASPRRAAEQRGGRVVAVRVEVPGAGW